MLENPTAYDIQTMTQPSYGPAILSPKDGEMNPISTRAAQKVGLGDATTLHRDYAIVQNMYRAILVPWLAEVLGLAEFDQRLADAGIPAVTTKDKQPFDLYAQRSVGVELSYLTIRNNLYIERLTREQIVTFLDRADDPGFASDAELVQIVMDTYPRVIRLHDSDAEFQTGFDMTGDFFWNDAIVVNLVYGETDEESDDQGKYNQLHEERIEFLHRGSFKPELEQHIDNAWPGHTKLYTTRVNLHIR